VRGSQQAVQVVAFIRHQNSDINATPPPSLLLLLLLQRAITSQ